MEPSLMQRFAGWFVGFAVISGFLYARFRMGHARFLNFFRRVAAIWFVSLGTLAAIVELTWAEWPRLFPDEPSAPASVKVVYSIVFGAVAVFGVYLMRTPTYRPDLGDTMRLMSTRPWSEELARRQGRSWWTGDPRKDLETIDPSAAI
jgi:hypothetical protein